MFARFAEGNSDIYLVVRFQNFKSFDNAVEVDEHVFVPLCHHDSFLLGIDELHGLSDVQTALVPSLVEMVVNIIERAEVIDVHELCV